MANVRANSETSASKRLLSCVQRPRIQAADGDARALSVEFLRCGQPISLLPPVMRTFLPASLPIVVTPLD